MTNSYDGVVSHTYTYDAEGNLIKVDGGAAAAYYYNVFNQRVRADIPGKVSRNAVHFCA